MKPDGEPSRIVTAAFEVALQGNPAKYEHIPAEHIDVTDDHIAHYLGGGVEFQVVTKTKLRD